MESSMVERQEYALDAVSGLAKMRAGL
jgi:hypothetical protein